MALAVRQRLVGRRHGRGFLAAQELRVGLLGELGGRALGILCRQIRGGALLGDVGRPRHSGPHTRRGPPDLRRRTSGRDRERVASARERLERVGRQALPHLREPERQQRIRVAAGASSSTLRASVSPSRNRRRNSSTAPGCRGRPRASAGSSRPRASRRARASRSRSFDAHSASWLWPDDVRRVTPRCRSSVFLDALLVVAGQPEKHARASCSVRARVMSSRWLIAWLTYFWAS